jgi:hypothetical protein
MTRLFFAAIAFLFLISNIQAADRSEEIRAEMWNTTDKNFRVVDIPSKWATESAVIIAQLNRFEYRKALMARLLRYNEYNHFRIKLIDKNAINRYSEMSYYPNYTSSQGESVKVYVGFKVIKKDGREIIVDLASAVKMEKEVAGNKQSYYKLAIPNLEPGDILDYYICEETTRKIFSYIIFFDPVIYRLPREYPVLNHKLQFRAERKCYINLKSLNGAPNLKLVNDDTNDEQYYTLEGSDIDGIKEQRWLFPYRELPTIKFRAAYAATAGTASYFDLLLGKPGVAKTDVSKDELQDLARSMMKGIYDAKFLTKFAKNKLKGVTDPFEIATQAYYFYRDTYFIDSEVATVQGGRMPAIRQLPFVQMFSAFLKSKKIPHDIVMAAARNISSIDNVLMENEIDWLIRVKKNNQYLYFSSFDINTIPGIEPLLEGTEAYALDGLISPSKWKATKITLPVSTSKDNIADVLIRVQFSDMTKANISVKKSLKGKNKLDDQYAVMDLYDFEKEERKLFAIEDTYASSGISKKTFAAMKSAYQSKRAEYKVEALNEMLNGNFDFKTKNPGNLVIEQTGRFLASPALIYSFTFEADEVMKKTGPNYIIDAGKLIESQTKIEGDELERKTNIYFENARSFVYKVVIDIPTGYEVQGLDKLNQHVENKFGGFTSTAKEENGKVIIETNKHYDVNFVPKDQWPAIVNFLNASYTFTEQKILLKKK